MEYITPFFMWLFLVLLPNLGTLVGILSCVSFVLLIASLIFARDFMYDGIITLEACKKILKSLVITLSISSLMHVCIPNKKELAAIVLVPAIVNNEQIQDIGNTSLDVLQEYLNAYVEEFKPSSSKN